MAQGKDSEMGSCSSFSWEKTQKPQFRWQGLNMTGISSLSCSLIVMYCYCHVIVMMQFLFLLLQGLRS